MQRQYFFMQTETKIKSLMVEVCYLMEVVEMSVNKTGNSEVQW